MGKSHKKIKNDRINALRKKYDAFLEEDKKRRERNEYILAQLDKMRSSTVLAPISTKVNYHNVVLYPTKDPRTDAEIRDAYLSHLERPHVTSSISSKTVDELCILKEISKKYILIPKRTMPIEINYIYNKDINDADWKTKYNILDDIKKLKKEGQSDPNYNQYKNDINRRIERQDLSKCSNSSDTQSNWVNDPSHFSTPSAEKKNDLKPVNKLNKDFPIDDDKVNKQVNFNVPESNSQGSSESNIPTFIPTTFSDDSIKVKQTQYIHNKHIHSQQEEVLENEKYNSENNEKEFNLINVFNNNSQICETSNINNSTVYQQNIGTADSNISLVETSKYIAPENIQADIANCAISEQIILDAKPQEAGTVEEAVKLDQNIDNQKHTNEIQDFTSTERVELYDIDKPPESQIIANQTTLDKPQYDDSVQSSITGDLENNQHPDHIEHENEINAFEAEQQEMFYSEQTHADTYAYNKEDGNTGDYTDGYEHNDQYAYYENVQQEQPYATNINEHEESTERYDPHYNQQYEGSYENQQPDNTTGYENTNAYEHQQIQDENEQFENIANYENQQQNAHEYQAENVSNINEEQGNILPEGDQLYDQHLYAEHQDTQENIEQQLITEEGYIESSSVITEGIQKDTKDEIEKVVDKITPEEPLFDPNMS